MKNTETTNDLIDIKSDNELVIKEVDLSYSENYTFEEIEVGKKTQKLKTRTSINSCNCHDCFIEGKL